jgi:acyl-CoA thioesterase YciA
MELITTKICMTLDIGVNNSLFGGNMLSFLDEAAAAYCCQVCRTTKMVTKKIEEVVFQSPVKVGNILKIYGEVDRIGNTSITLKLEARKHNVYTEKQDIVCSTKIVFVKIDEEGNPIPISERVKNNYTEESKKIKK